MEEGDPQPGPKTGTRSRQELLEEVKQAQRRLFDAERAFEVARADFHHVTRLLHLSGVSLREISELLGLSHQRVYQIVEGAGGARRWRALGRRPEQPECSFCGARKPTLRLVAGPHVYICDDCATAAGEVLASGEPVRRPTGTIVPVPARSSEEKCSFCGKRADQASGLAAREGPDLGRGKMSRPEICAECLALCRDILAERL